MKNLGTINPLEMKKYADIFLSGKSFMVIDNANQCLFATQSERKAKNFLAKTLKAAGY